MFYKKVFDINKFRARRELLLQEAEKYIPPEMDTSPERRRPKTYCELLLENPALIDTGLKQLALCELAHYKYKKQMDLLNSKNTPKTINENKKVRLVMSNDKKKRPDNKKQVDDNKDKNISNVNIVPGDPADDIEISSRCTFGIHVEPVDKNSQSK